MFLSPFVLHASIDLPVTRFAQQKVIPSLWRDECPAIKGQSTTQGIPSAQKTRPRQTKHGRITRGNPIRIKSSLLPFRDLETICNHVRPGPRDESHTARQMCMRRLSDRKCPALPRLLLSPIYLHNCIPDADHDACMYVCMYMYMCVCVYTYVYIYIYI